MFFFSTRLETRTVSLSIAVVEQFYQVKRMIRDRGRVVFELFLNFKFSLLLFLFFGSVFRGFFVFKMQKIDFSKS